MRLFVEVHVEEEHDGRGDSDSLIESYVRVVEEDHAIQQYTVVELSINFLFSTLLFSCMRILFSSIFRFEAPTVFRVRWL